MTPDSPSAAVHLATIQGALLALASPARQFILLTLLGEKRKGLSEREIVKRFPGTVSTRTIRRHLRQLEANVLVEAGSKKGPNGPEPWWWITDIAEFHLKETGLSIDPPVFLAFLRRQISAGRMWRSDPTQVPPPKPF